MDGDISSDSEGGNTYLTLRQLLLSLPKPFLNNKPERDHKSLPTTGDDGDISNDSGSVFLGEGGATLDQQVRCGRYFAWAIIIINAPRVCSDYCPVT